MTDVITHHANDRTNHFSNSAGMLKFCVKGQIPWLSSKFRGPRKTVGPNHQTRCWCKVETVLCRLL